MNAPGDKRNAAPAEAEDGSFGKHKNGSTASPAAQVAENPLMALCKAWLRASPQAMRELLLDVKGAHPALWATVTREGSIHD